MKATELGRRRQRPVFAAWVTGGKGRGAKAVGLGRGRICS